MIKNIDQFENFSKYIGKLTKVQALQTYFDLVVGAIERYDKGISDEELAKMEWHHVVPRYSTKSLGKGDTEIVVESPILYLPFYRLEHALLHYCLAVIEDELGNKAERDGNINAITAIIKKDIIDRVSLNLIIDEETFNDLINWMNLDAKLSTKIKAKKILEPIEFYVLRDNITAEPIGVFSEQEAIESGKISTRSMRDLQKDKYLNSKTYGNWIAVDRDSAEKYKEKISIDKAKVDSDVTIEEKRPKTTKVAKSSKSEVVDERVMEGAVAVNETTGEIHVASTQKLLAQVLDLPDSPKTKNDSSPISRGVRGISPRYIHPETNEKFKFYGLPGPKTCSNHVYPGPDLAKRLRDGQASGLWKEFDFSHLVS